MTFEVCYYNTSGNTGICLHMMRRLDSKFFKKMYRTAKDMCPAGTVWVWSGLDSWSDKYGDFAQICRYICRVI